MSVDQRLELHALLPALVEEGLITPDAAQRLSAAHPDNAQHPLERVAAHGPSLETLTQWLAQRAPATLSAYRPVEDRCRNSGATDVPRVRPAPRHSCRGRGCAYRYRRQRPAPRQQLGIRTGAKYSRAFDQASRCKPSGHPAVYQRVLPAGEVRQRGPIKRSWCRVTSSC